MCMEDGDFFGELRFLALALILVLAIAVSFLVIKVLVKAAKLRNNVHSVGVAPERYIP